MKDLFNSALSFELFSTFGKVSHTKRGSKRFCGRIIKSRRDRALTGNITYTPETAELFSDAKLAAWLRDK